MTKRTVRGFLTSDAERLLPVIARSGSDEAISTGFTEGKLKRVYEVHHGLLEIHDNEITAEGVDFRPRFK